MSTISNDFDRCLGERIRAEREMRGWSLSDLSEESGVSRAMIHKIERGESSPTASLLGKLCGAFRLTVSSLIARAEAGGQRLVRRADQQVWTDPETGYSRRHVSPAAGSPIDIVEVDLPAGAMVSYPASSFVFLRQCISMVEGELTFIEGDLVHELATGDCLLLGPAADCTFHNRGDKACRYVVTVLKAA
ncbi:helix-turn-helix domain-containing protein [Rhizobium grahamii]|uniref:Helix-turn-helix domain-containing protein n=2 Tax=Rhizobium TaxID=379 RepID=A0A5Q0C1Z9_9HYPH|nr:XRE family transcriptional regulator [Rhizobium grahamii]QFY59463.1 helix-turn-helix domain-containing protein [Rhizobium grahamii]QRM48011.1 helix-turn-helix domain-containing protein [Rhizobium sp. BG6]